MVHLIMFRKNFLPSSVESSIPSVSNHGRQEFSCAWGSNDGNWQESCRCNRPLHDGCLKAAPCTEHKNRDDGSSFSIFMSCSQLSTITTMSESCTPIIVYKRRKVKKNPAALLPAQISTDTRVSDCCLSASSSDAPFLATLNNGKAVSHDAFPKECKQSNLPSKSETVDAVSLEAEPVTEEDPKSDMERGLDGCFFNYSCSSSESNLGVYSASLNRKVDDTDECSSSGVLTLDCFRDDITEKDIITSVLKTHGIIGGVRTRKSSAFDEHMHVKSKINGLRSCKVCDRSEMTTKMLICDSCEEAFHVSCCNPSPKKITIDEWLCNHCFRKKLKRLKERSSKKLANGEVGSSRTGASKDDLGSIEFMLKDTEPYTTNVRIGNYFQAEVPDWSGPTTDRSPSVCIKRTVVYNLKRSCAVLIHSGVGSISEPVENSHSECINHKGWNDKWPSRLGSIGNWLQCREVIDGVGEGVDGTICGKWRRAPLFEVQTDDWECFRCVLWDPIHADCSVPQELNAEEVQKHLKYIEMLRARLGAKGRKLGVGKSVNLKEVTEARRNTRTL